MGYGLENNSRCMLERKKRYLDILKSLVHIKTKVSISKCLSTVSEDDLKNLQHDIMDLIEAGVFREEELTQLKKGFETVSLCLIIKGVYHTHTEYYHILSKDIVGKFLHLIDEQSRVVKGYLRSY